MRSIVLMTCQSAYGDHRLGTQKWSTQTERKLFPLHCSVILQPFTTLVWNMLLEKEGECSPFSKILLCCTEMKSEVYLEGRFPTWLMTICAFLSSVVQVSGVSMNIAGILIRKSTAMKLFPHPLCGIPLFSSLQPSTWRNNWHCIPYYVVLVLLELGWI